MIQLYIQKNLCNVGTQGLSTFFKLTTQLMMQNNICFCFFIIYFLYTFIVTFSFFSISFAKNVYQYSFESKAVFIQYFDKICSFAPSLMFFSINHYFFIFLRFITYTFSYFLYLLSLFFFLKQFFNSPSKNVSSFTLKLILLEQNSLLKPIMADLYSKLSIIQPSSSVAMMQSDEYLATTIFCISLYQTLYLRSAFLKTYMALLVITRILDFLIPFGFTLMVQLMASFMISEDVFYLLKYLSISVNSYTQIFRNLLFNQSIKKYLYLQNQQGFQFRGNNIQISIFQQNIQNKYCLTNIIPSSSNFSFPRTYQRISSKISDFSQFLSAAYMHFLQFYSEFMKESENIDKCYIIKRNSQLFHCFNCCTNSTIEPQFLMKRLAEKAPPTLPTLTNNQSKISLKKFTKHKKTQIQQNLPQVRPKCEDLEKIEKNIIPPNIREWKSADRHRQTHSMPEFISPPKLQINKGSFSWKNELVQSFIIPPHLQSQKSLQTEKTLQSTTTLETFIPQQRHFNCHYEPKLMHPEAQAILINPFVKAFQEQQKELQQQPNQEVHKSVSILEYDLVGQFSIKEVLSEGDEEKTQDQFSQVYRSPKFSGIHENNSDRKFKFQHKEPFTFRMKKEQ